MLKDKRIGLFITGGIASYKMAELTRQLIKKGAHVRVAMTKGACEFITPLTMQTLTKAPVLIDTFDEKEAEIVQHVHLADWCEYAIIAPATANILAKMVHGIADEIVSTTLMALHCPRLIVPAMNSNMYLNPATQRNIKQLEQDGYEVMIPETGFLAEGYSGIGRLPELEIIVSQLERIVARYEKPQILKDKHIIISAGGTRERIDPVRYISNDSTGKMGYAMAQAAVDLGAKVTLVSTVNLIPPLGVKVKKVSSAIELYEVMTDLFEQQDIAVMTAAVSDYRVVNQEMQKIKKQANSSGLTLELIENPDILATLGSFKKSHQLVVGFAAETEKIEEYAKAKLIKKNADWIVANDVSRMDAGFNVDTNQVTLFGKKGQVIELPLQSKKEIAFSIWEEIMRNENEAN